MERAAEFEKWLQQMLKDAEEKLSLSDDTIAYFLFREGMNHYLKAISKRNLQGEKSMPSEWATDMIQKLRLNCAEGTAGKCAACQKGIEELIVELDKRKSQIEYIAHLILQMERNN